IDAPFPDPGRPWRRGLAPQRRLVKGLGDIVAVQGIGKGSRITIEQEELQGIAEPVLGPRLPLLTGGAAGQGAQGGEGGAVRGQGIQCTQLLEDMRVHERRVAGAAGRQRSEERRVGKECRRRWSACQYENRGGTQRHEVAWYE